MVVSTKDNSFGVASVVIGILSIIFSTTVFFGSFGGVILAVVGLIFAILQRKRVNTSWAKAGLWINGIALVLGIIVVIWLVQLLADIVQNIQQMQSQGLL